MAVCLLLIQAGLNHAQAEVLLEEDFEGSAASFPSGAWGAAKVEISSDNPAKGNFSLKFTDSADAEKPYFPYTSGRFSEISEGVGKVSFDYYSPDSTPQQFLVEVGGGADKRLLRLCFLGAKLLAVKNGKNEGDIVTKTITPNEWHHITIDFTLPRSDSGFSVTIDGEKIEGLPFWETQEIGTLVDRVRFYDDGVQSDTVFIDNLVVEKVDQ
jgi:hypothetical protein